MLSQLFVYGYAIMEALEMERPMTEWNDDRVDELNERVKDGFAEVDKRFEQVDKRFDKVDARFIRLEGEMKGGFARVDERFDKLNDRFDRLLFILIAACIGLVGTLLVAALGFVVQS
jgi:archaellum component FlaC